MKQHEYSYCFLRYRQDPDAGEFANIGVALWSPESRFLAFEGSKRFSRLTHFFGDLDRDGYRLLIAHVERRFDALNESFSQNLPFDKKPENIQELAGQVIPEDDGSIIWSAPRGGLSNDPNAELSRLFEKYIGRHNEAEEKSRRNDGAVYREVFRKAFSDVRVASKLHEHEIVAPLANHVFKHAWKNGVWNVYETLSFDMVDTEAIERKAHTWFGRSVHLAESVEKPNMFYLLGKPSVKKNVEAYNQAKKILASAPKVKVVEEDGAEEFAEELKESVSKAA